jgi:hypothetical protein
MVAVSCGERGRCHLLEPVRAQFIPRDIFCKMKGLVS